MSTITPERAAHLDEQMTAVIANPGWDRVASVFEIELPPDDDREGRMYKLQGISDVYWDKRGGGIERQAAQFNQEVADRIAAQGDEGLASFYGGVQSIGMIGTRKAVKGRADTSVVSGGTVDANEMRSLHAQPSKNVAYVGTHRPLGDAERERMRLYAPNPGFHVNTEADSLRAIMDVLHPEKVPIIRARDHHIYQTEQGLVVWANAPAIEGDKRANTRDTFRCIGALMGDQLGKVVEISTNDIYAGFQGVDGQHIFGGLYGADEVSVASFTPQYGAHLATEAGYPIEAKARTAGVYAQELRSTLNSVDAAYQTIATAA